MKPRSVSIFFNNRVFCTDTSFIRTENTVGARSAQWSLLAFDGIQDVEYEADLPLRLLR